MSHPENVDHAALLRLINASWTTQAIATACTLGVPDRLAGGIQQVDALAESIGCDARSLARLLRALTSLGLCTQLEQTRFELTGRGMLLRTGSADSLAAWAMFAGGSSWKAWGELQQCVLTGTSYRERHYGGADFAHLANDEQTAKLFHRAMADITRQTAKAVANTIEFAGVTKAVDVGGGSGTLIAALLAKYPAMLGVLYDLDHAIEDAKSFLTEAGVIERCACQVGDFFDAVPAGADAYLLKSILHDWDDARCARILGNCRRAMHEGARLYVIERIVPARYQATDRDQAIARSDLNMLVALRGRERTQSEYESLLEASGLGAERTSSLTSEFSVIQALRGPC